VTSHTLVALVVSKPSDRPLLQASQPLSTAPRLDQAELAGDYNVFDVSAVPVEETDPFTGGTSAPAGDVPECRMERALMNIHESA
jgi:hypothetical protein